MENVVLVKTIFHQADEIPHGLGCFIFKQLQEEALLCGLSQKGERERGKKEDKVRNVCKLVRL